MADFSDLTAESAHFDPFFERRPSSLHVRKYVLGAPFCFKSDSVELLGLVEAAYGGLPEYRLPMDANEYCVDLCLVERAAQTGNAEPAPVRMRSGAGLLCGVMDESNYAVVAPDFRRALVVVSRDRLEDSRHVRRELIEFVVYLLAARGLGLVPLHAACIGRGERGVLLFGARGAGKSTLCLHALTSGLELMAEDAICVHPQSLLAVGVPAFLHLRADALRFVDVELLRRIRDAPVVQRRSGEKKIELDTRALALNVAVQPLRIVAAVLATDIAAEDTETLLSPMTPATLVQRLRSEQPYASHQPAWNQFEAAMVRLGAFELCRGEHPAESLRAIERLLEEGA